MENGYLTGCGLIISVIVSFIFFTKSRLENKETTIFKYMLLVNIFEALTTTAIVIVALTINANWVFVLLNRIDVILIITWCSLLFYYIYSISNENSEEAYKKGQKFCMIVNIIFYVLALFLSVKIVNQDGILDSYGPLTILGFIGASVYIILMIITVIRKRKFGKKYIPFYIFLILLIFIALLRVVIPRINFISISFSFISLIMAYTIENPDMKMMEEIIRIKNLATTSRQDKTVFIYNVVQKLRAPLSSIKEIIDSTNNKNDISLLKQGLQTIDNEVNHINLIINDILDISLINTEQIKVYNEKYDIRLLAKQLILKYQPLLNENVKFQTQIDEDIPLVLGDSVRIKQVISSILNNAVKYTQEGYVELSISSIVKQDTCRLIIGIEDSGYGMDLLKSSKIFNEDVTKNMNIENMDTSDVSLPIVKKIVDYIGGTIILDSEEKKGTTVTVILDQKIPKDQDSFEYKNIINSRKNILLISQDCNEIKDKMDKSFYEANMKVTYVDYGIKGLNLLRNKEDFDLILIYDNLKAISSSEIIDKIIQEGNYKGKLIVVADASKEKEFMSKRIYGFIEDNIKLKDLINKIKEYL